LRGASHSTQEFAKVLQSKVLKCTEDNLIAASKELKQYKEVHPIQVESTELPNIGNDESYPTLKVVLDCLEARKVEVRLQSSEEQKENIAPGPRQGN